MECRVCGNIIEENAVECGFCRCPVRSSDEIDNELDAAIAAAEVELESKLESELEACLEIESPDSVDEGADVEDDPESDAAEDPARKKTARERIREMREAVQKGTDSAITIGRRVSDGTSRAVKKTKHVSSDVSDKVGHAVDKSREIGRDVSVHAHKTGEGIGKAVKKTKKTMDDLGQVGVIITQRSLDVVRASLKAIEIIDDYLDSHNSNYEVGNFITGIGIPPYLEVEFHKKTGGITHEERDLLESLRSRGISCSDIEEILGLPAETESPDDIDSDTSPE